MHYNNFKDHKFFQEFPCSSQFGSLWNNKLSIEDAQVGWYNRNYMYQMAENKTSNHEVQDHILVYKMIGKVSMGCIQ